MHQSLAQLAGVKKPKLRGRGRPFCKGHQLGLTTRFKKGEPSANPTGRPKSREINKAYRSWISANVTLEELRRHKLPLELFGHSRAEVIAWVRGEATLAGSLSDGVELADRAEGKPFVSLSVTDERSDPIGLLMIEMEQIRESGLSPYASGLPETEAKEEDDDEGRSEESAALEEGDEGAN